MKVKDVMSRSVWTSTPETPLSEIARIMWDKDCGFVPIADAQTKALRGVITDRDICMAAWTRGRPLGEIPASRVLARDVHCCRETDDLSVVHESMRRHQVRRLPVVDAANQPIGVVSLNDLARTAKDAHEQRDVAATLGEVCRHRVPAAAQAT